MSIRALVAATATATATARKKLCPRFRDVFTRTYDLGFTSFGGPPVHFQILHRRFVDGLGKTPWIDEQTYQELFAICQALPGPGSTKLAFNITMAHAGLGPAVMVFLLWSLPGALGMYGLALGVQHISETLPAPVYALLSGLNAATVGIIALAAVQLARKAVTDRLTRALVMGSGCAGLCYNALWYFPVLMVIGGATTAGWDCWGRKKVRCMHNRIKRMRKGSDSEQRAEESVAVPIEVLGGDSTTQRRQLASEVPLHHPTSNPLQEEQPTLQPSVATSHRHAISVKWGIFLIAAFFVSFITLMTVRGSLQQTPLPLSLFNNMYLAGTIIFGGGPVVIPLLREYVVEPGWVSPRNFLLGLALIQAFPGPNFNFAVYLGGLTLSHYSTTLGAILGFVGIFSPGLILAVGFQSMWRVARKRREVVSVLRGINAAAVGLVFTAVYRLWEIGYLTPEDSAGASLAKEPWWLVVAASTFTMVEWFGVPPAAAIITGGVAGIGWWGAIVK